MTHQDDRVKTKNAGPFKKAGVQLSANDASVAFPSVSTTTGATAFLRAGLVHP